MLLIKYQKIIDLFGVKDLQPFYMEYTPSLKRIMEKSILEAKKLGNDKVSTDILTYCLLNEEENVAKELLKQLDVDVDKIKKHKPELSVVVEKIKNDFFGEKITVTGNTVIDALYWVVNKIKEDKALNNELKELLESLHHFIDHLRPSRVCLAVLGVPCIDYTPHF